MRIFLIIALILAAIAVVCIAATTVVFGVGALGWFIFSWTAYLVNDITNQYRLGTPIG
jgi:uncharacterized membrane protein